MKILEEIIREQIISALDKLGLLVVSFGVEMTKNLSNGDWASNVALVAARQLGNSPVDGPRKLAEQIKNALPLDPDGYIEKVEVAGPGFLNFFISDKYLEFVIENCKLKIEKFGHNDSMRGRKVMVEYTDPNVMKPFHIGHLMSNSIGESLSRLYQSAGAEVARANYFSDVGLAIAKAVWGMREMKLSMPAETAGIVERTDFLGKAYAFGVKEAEDNPEVTVDVREINKQIYNKTEGEILDLYKTGRRWSMEHFDSLYKKLGTSFDYLISESEVVELGLAACKKAMDEGLFVESEGAIVFPADKSGLHIRVFITKEGLPTYETKDLGLCKRKNELFPFDLSISITANEQDDYFEVIFKAVEMIYPEFADKLRHVSHGMLRLPSGKMSSRTGNVITGESLIADVTTKALEKNNDLVVAEKVAIGAIKYEILKQAPGRDIIFDLAKSLSLEGDSGPYLQYTIARAKSVMAKGNYELGIMNYEWGEREKKLMRLIARWQEVLLEAQKDLAPQQIVTYLIQLAGEFNSFYASNQIINPEEKRLTEERLILTAALAQTLSNGLWILGIPILDRM